MATLVFDERIATVNCIKVELLMSLLYIAIVSIVGLVPLEVCLCSADAK